jgi:hypothetical protein
LGDVIGRAFRTISWAGTQNIEPVVNRIHNKLVLWILYEDVYMPKYNYPPPGAKELEEARQDIKEGIRIYEWLAAQKPMASVETFHRNKLTDVKGLVTRAIAAFKELFPGKRAPTFEPYED